MSSKYDKKKNPYDYCMGILFILILAVVPIIVGIKFVDVSKAELDNTLRVGESVADVFSYYKSVVICCVTSLMAVFYIFYTAGHGKKEKADIKSPVIIFGGAFAFFVVLSSVLSEYGEIVLSGITERYESIWILLAYMGLMFFAFSFVKNKFRLNFIVGGVFTGIALVGTIGAFQFFGMDFFNTDFAAKIVLGKYYEGNSLQIKFDDVYSTLYNPNCVGMYSAMLLPFTSVMAVSLPLKNKLKYAAVVLSGILAVNLIGSSSEGGLIGAAAALFTASAMAVIYIFKNKKYKQVSVLFTASVMAVVIIVFVLTGIFVFSSQDVKERISGNFEVLFGGREQSNSEYFKDLSIDGNKAVIYTENDNIVIEYDEKKEGLQVSDSKENILLSYNDGVLFKNEKKSFDINSENLAGTVVEIVGKYALVRRNNISFLFEAADGKLYINDKKYNRVDIEQKIESIGFKGKEMFGTGRGYIWSRSIPLVFQNGIRGILYGNGPDTFALVFPQYDCIGKLRYLGNPYIIVDKPHNFYLQTAINTGLISLISLILLFAVYVCQSVVSILKDKEKDRLVFSVKFALFAGIIGYLISALSTDSVVSVAPVFWVLLGTGFAVNRFCK